MPESFNSFEEFADHLRMAVVPNIPTAMREGLDEVGQHLVETAQAKFGTYQKAVYKYPKWVELSEATKEDRVSKGFSADEPLLRTGATRDSIGYEINGDDVVVGSSEPTMVYHEMGTKTEPPRPVLGPTAYESRNIIREIMGKATVLALVPGMKLAKALGFKRTGPRITSEAYNRYKGLDDV